MKTIRTPDEHYYNGRCVKFSTSRKDGELYYTISVYGQGMDALFIAENGKVKD